MKATLLLTEKAKTTRLMLNDVAFDDLSVRDTRAHVGGNCDRWGHPCAECLERNKPNESRRSDFITGQTVK